VDPDTTFGSVNLIKIDLAHDFCRVLFGLYDVSKLGVAFPPLDFEEPLAAIPLALPRGCVNSPPYSCSTTEMVTDIAS
jgi:hypothetical protein